MRKENEYNKGFNESRISSKKVEIGILSILLSIIFAVILFRVANKQPVAVEMVEVEGGAFEIGVHTETEVERIEVEGIIIKNTKEAGERLIQKIEVSDFYISKYPITQEEYAHVCSGVFGTKNPSFFKVKKHPKLKGDTSRRPVENISWYDTIKFINNLNKQEGLPPSYNRKGDLLDAEGNITNDPSKVKGYRLPTEAEWEYAARGGKPAIAGNSFDHKYSGGHDLSEVAWYFGNSDAAQSELGQWTTKELLQGFSIKDAIYKGFIKEKGTMPVGQKQSNELGIFDMCGNVSEWCSDRYRREMYKSEKEIVKNPCNSAYASKFDNYRVIRGGSWTDRDCSITKREEVSASKSTAFIGFRVVRTKTD